MILLPLLCLLSPGFGPASAQDTRPNNMVTVSEGEDALLNCDLSSENSVRRATFDWRKNNGEHEVFMYDDGKYSGSDLDSPNYLFAGRVEFFEDKVASGNASIKIKNTLLNDTGTYTCLIMNPLTPVVNIILNVGAAQVPYIETVHDEITWRELKCKAKGVPEPEVEWRNSAGNLLANHVPQNQNGRSHVELLLNVSRSDNYTCVVTQRSIYHQVNYTMKVNIPETVAAYIYYSGWIVAAVCICIIIGGVCFYCAKRKKQPAQQSKHESKDMNGPSSSELLTS